MLSHVGMLLSGKAQRCLQASLSETINVQNTEPYKTSLLETLDAAMVLLRWVSASALVVITHVE